MASKFAKLVIGLFAAALLLEAGLRLLPVSTGYHYQPTSDANPVLRGMPHAHYTYSLGWNFREIQHGTLNDEGYQATYDYAGSSGKSVLMIGDSYVQGAAVTPGSRMHELITQRLLPTRVVALSRAGGSLPDYLALLHWGIQKYHPRAVVILIVIGDVDDSLSAKPGGHSFVSTPDGISLRRLDRPPLGRMREALYESMLLRYLYDNLAFPVNLPRHLSIPARDPTTRLRVSQFFLDELARAFPAEKTLLMFHRGRRDRSFSFDADIDVLLTMARERGFRTMDLASRFTTYEQQTGQRLDYSPVDTHWNARAHALVAGDLVPLLRQTAAEDVR